MTDRLDVAANRRASKWTGQELFCRFLWGLAQPVLRLIPRQFWRLRRCLLRLFGAKVGREVHVHRTVRIMIPWNLSIGDEAAIGDCVEIYNLGYVRIGAQATISQGAHLCAGTHDYRRPDLPLVKGTITIGRGAWICADAFVGPDVSVGEFAVLGARAVAVRDVAPGMVVAGNPARVIGQRQCFDPGHRSAREKPSFDVPIEGVSPQIFDPSDSG
jgi:putative colanic acid biosynthesis acetyltransferase WcaF